MFVKLLIALLLVLLNGFFVAAEFSIVKVRYSQIQIKAAEGNKMAKASRTYHQKFRCISYLLHN